MFNKEIDCILEKVGFRMSTHKREKAIKQISKNNGVSVAESQKEIEITINITMVNLDS